MVDDLIRLQGASERPFHDAAVFTLPAVRQSEEHVAIGRDRAPALPFGRQRTPTSPLRARVTSAGAVDAAPRAKDRLRQCERAVTFGTGTRDPLTDRIARQGTKAPHAFLPLPARRSKGGAADLTRCGQSKTR